MPLTALLKRLAACGGCMNADDVAQLAELDRLRQCLVRCNGGRFVTAAQNVKHYIAIIERDFNHLQVQASGESPEVTAMIQGADYVRDVSLLASDRAFQGDYRPVTAPPQPRQNPVPTPRQIEQRMDAVFNNTFRENDCSGVFDGFSVTSDADPGL